MKRKFSFILVLTILSINGFSQLQQEELVIKMVNEVGRVLETSNLAVSNVNLSSTDQTYVLKGNCSILGISNASFTSIFDVTGRIKSFSSELPMVSDKSKWNKMLNNSNWTSFFLPDDVKNVMALSKYTINFSNTLSIDDIGVEFSLTENALSVFGIRDLKLSGLKIGYKIDKPTTAPSLSGKIGGSASWGSTTVALESNLVTKAKDWEIYFALSNLAFNDIVSKFSITQDLVIPASVNSLLKIDYAKITVKPASYSFVFDGGSPLGNVNFVVKRVTTEGKPVATDTSATNTSLTGAYASTQVNVPGSGPSNNVSSSSAEHKWGIMAGFQLPQSNNAIPAIKTMRDIGLTNIAVVASTFDDNVETNLPLFSNLGTGNTSISKGFTFMAWIPVNDLLNKHKLMKPLKAFAPAFISAIQASNTVQNVMFRANLPVNITDFSLEGDINFNDNMQLIPTTDIIVLRQLKLMMTPMAAAPQFSFGAGWEMKIDPTRKEPLKFEAAILVSPTAATLGLSGTMKSSWDDPYGMIGIGINSPKIQAALNFSNDGIPIPDDIFFTGQLQYGKIVGDVTVGINYNELTKNMVVARTCNLSLKNVLDQWLGGLVKTEFDKKKSAYLSLLDDALNMEFKDAYIKAVPPQAPVSLMNGLRMENDYTKNCKSMLTLGNTWLPGVRLAAEGTFAGWHGMFDIGAEGNLTALQAGVTIKGMLDPIKLSTKGFKIFHLSGAKSDNDPFELYFDLSTNNIMEGVSGFISPGGGTTAPGKIFYLSGKTTILEAGQGKALIELTTQGYHMQVKGKIYKFLDGTIDATIKDFKNILTNTQVEAKINVGSIQNQVAEELGKVLNNIPLFNEVNKGFRLESIEFKGELAGLQSGADATFKFSLAGKTYTATQKIIMDGNVKDLAEDLAKKIKDVAADGIAVAKKIVDDAFALSQKAAEEFKLFADKKAAELKANAIKATDEAKKLSDQSLSTSKAAYDAANDLARNISEKTLSTMTNAGASVYNNFSSAKSAVENEANNLKKTLSSAAPVVFNQTRDGLNTIKNKSLKTATDFGNFTKNTVEKIYNKSTDKLENSWSKFKNIFERKDNEELITVNGPAFRLVTRYNGYVIKAVLTPKGTRNAFLHMMPAQNTAEEMWQVVPNDKEGMFYLVSAYSGMLLAEPDHNARLLPHESDHKGRERLIMEAVPNEPGWYFIKYNGSGYYLALNGTGINSRLVAVKNKLNNDQGKFRFEKSGDVNWSSKNTFPPQISLASSWVENNLYQVNGQPEVYRYSNGSFRWIPDMETLTALKLNGKPITSLQFDREIGISLGRPMPSLKDGAFIQADNDPTKYVMEKGKRRAIPDYETFSQVGNESLVQIISPQDLQEITKGDALPSRFAVKPPLIDKMLYRPAGEGTVYVLTNNMLRGIPDPETMAMMGYNFNMVQDVSQHDLSSLSKSAALPSRKNGMILKAQGENQIYLMEKGIRRLVPDMETSDALKLNLANAKEINKQDLLAIPEGPAFISLKPASISSYENALYQANGDPKVYIVLNKTLRHIPNIETLHAMGYMTTQIHPVTSADLKKLPVGKMLPSRADNNLIKAENESTVYIIEKGIRRSIPDAETFTALKLDWNKVQSVNKKDLTDIPEGPGIKSIK